MKTDVQLPEKNWALLELALSDLRKCEADKDYSIDMGRWHGPYQPFPGLPITCAVCLGGAVLAKTFELDKNYHIKWLVAVGRFGFSKEVRDKLGFLNSVRQGQFDEFLDLKDFQRVLTYRIDNGFLFEDGFRRNPTEYGNNPEQFYRDMEGIVKMFKTLDI